MSEQAASRRLAFYVVVSGLILWTLVLWPLHDALSMWVEGMPAYVDQLLGILRRACTPPVNVIDVGDRVVPLAIDPYQGPLMTYLDVPLARAWVGSAIDDLYAYRYKGIVLLALSGALLYVVALRLAPPIIAALGALAFVTLPALAVTTLSDLQYHTPILAAVLLIVVALIKYAETRRARWWFAAALACGLSLLTRAEALVWTVAAIGAWLLLERRSLIADWWRTTAHKGWLIVGGIIVFLVGAAPFVVMNALYPDYGLFSFVFVTGPSRVSSGLQVLDVFAARGAQFLRYVLFNRFGLFDATVRQYVYFVVAAASIVALAIVGVRERRWPLALVALLVVLPLSTIANRGPREIHLLPLAIPVIAIVIEACGRLPLRRGALVLSLVIVSNLMAGALVVNQWRALRASDNTSMAGHSCPECLSAALAKHADAQAKFTNVGLYQEALWASRAHTCGEDILSWGDDARFRRYVVEAVERGDRLVFVGYPAEREDALAGRVLQRARALESTLRTAGVPFRTEQVDGPNGLPYYQLTIVTPPPSRVVVTGGGLNPAQGKRVTGWIDGRGFRPTDRIFVDRTEVDPAYGSPQRMTFSLDAARLRGQSGMNVQVVGTDDAARSPTVRIGLR